MMKKYIIIILAILLMTVFTGCSDKNDNKVETSGVTETNLRTAIPDPYDFFTEEDVVILIDNEESIYYQIKNYDGAKYNSYLQACKDFGYTDVTCEINTEESELYYAYDEDHRYYLKYGFGGEKKYIDIICDVVKVEKTEDDAS